MPSTNPYRRRLLMSQLAGTLPHRSSWKWAAPGGVVAVAPPRAVMIQLIDYSSRRPDETVHGRRSNAPEACGTPGWRVGQEIIARRVPAAKLVARQGRCSASGGAR